MPKSGQTVRPNEDLAGNTDTSFLKMLALLFMLIDHMGVVIYPGVGEMRIIGRMAFPLYAWCLVVGNVKTHNPAHYALRLLVLAAISQPLYMLALNHTWKDFSVLFSLLIATLAIQGIRAQFFGSQIWVPALCYLLLGYMKVDYGWRGLTFVLVLYGARKTRSGLIAAYLAYALFWGSASSSITNVFGYELPFLTWKGLGTVFSALFRLQGMVWLSLPLVIFNTNSGMRINKWMGYGLYPLHLVILIIMRLLRGTPISTLIQGF